MKILDILSNRKVLLHNVLVFMVKLMSYRSISSQVLVEEAELLWLRVEIINREKNLFLVSSDTKEVLFKSTDCGLNSSLGLKIANDKELTYDMLQRAWLPVAHTKYVLEWEVDAWFDDSWFTYPLVVKPLDGAHGDGVIMNIQDKTQLLESLESSFKDGHTRMIIQDQVEGDEYRIMVLNGKVIACFQRAYPIVIWDWKLSIKELIEYENENNSDRSEKYNSFLSYIRIDEECVKQITSLWFTLDSIPRLWENIIVRRNSNVWSWWTIVNMIDVVSEEFKNMAILATKAVWLTLCWIDVLTDNIWSKNIDSSTILEVWATPWIWVHWIGAWEKILQELF